MLSPSEIVLVLVSAGAGLLLVVTGAALSWRKRRAARARLSPVGRLASVERDLDPEGFVLLDGELWPARATRAGTVVRRGSLNVRVVAARGHFLEVEPGVR